MIVKIHQSRAHMKSVIEYNERKVDEGTAEVEWSRDLDASTRLTVERSFREIEKKKFRSDCKNISLHISINPTNEDGMTGEKIRDFAEDLLDRLGYGSQPYILYRHSDIDRIHWHLVSIRLNSEGRKIKESFEREKTQRVLFQLSEKYGYIPNKEGKKKKEQKADKKSSVKPSEPEQKKEKTSKEEIVPEEMQKKIPEEPLQEEDNTIITSIGNNNEYDEDEDYIPGSEVWEEDSKDITETEEKIFEEGAPVRSSIKDAIESSIAYHFTTMSQFMLILEAHGLRMKKNDKASFEKEGMKGITLQGLASDGEPCTSPIPLEEIQGGALIWETLLHRMDTCVKDGKTFQDVKEDLKKEIKSAVQQSASEEEIKEKLSEKGIQIDFFKTAEGKIYGVNIIDHKAKAAFKASEISRELSAKYFELLREEGITSEQKQVISHGKDTQKKSKALTGTEKGSLEEMVTKTVFTAMKSLLNAGVAVSSRRAIRNKGDRDVNIKYTPTNASKTTKKTAGGEIVRV